MMINNSSREFFQGTQLPQHHKTIERPDAPALGKHDQRIDLGFSHMGIRTLGQRGYLGNDVGQRIQIAKGQIPVA